MKMCLNTQQISSISCIYIYMHIYKRDTHTYIYIYHIHTLLFKHSHWNGGMRSERIHINKFPQLNIPKQIFYN